MNLVAARDEAAAEQELRIALQQAENMRFLFGPRLEMATRAMLAAVLFDNGKRDEANATARPLCQAQSDGKLPASLHKLLADGHFCEG
jgi:hypothetical protein